MIDIFESEDPPEAVFKEKTEDIDKMSLSIMLNAYKGTTNTDLLLKMDRAIDSSDPATEVKNAYQALQQRLKGGFDTNKDSADII